MSKKTVPIWERVSEEKLTQKQEEYDAFWSEMPHSRERLYCIDTYQSPKLPLDGKLVDNLKPGGKAIRKKYKQYYEEWQVTWLDSWKKRYSEFGDEMNTKLIDAQTEYVNEVFEYQDLSVLPEDSDVTHILEAIRFFEENHPGNSNKAIQELALLLTKQYDGALFKTIEKEYRTAPQRKAKSGQIYHHLIPIAEEVFNKMYMDCQGLKKKEFRAEFKKERIKRGFNNGPNDEPIEDTINDWFDKFKKNIKLERRT